MTVDERRLHALNSKPITDGPIVYWMSRDQRVHDNWALLYAQELAKKKGQCLHVVFCLVPRFLEATIRQYGFMLNGLEEVELELQKFNIEFCLLLGDPSQKIPEYISDMKAGAIITDFDPLRIKKIWKDNVAHEVSCACIEVDAHNIVPCRKASPKQEFGAYTLRPKIHKVLFEYLTDFPKVEKQSYALSNRALIDWKKIRQFLEVNLEVKEVEWCISGEKAAQIELKKFIDERLCNYDQHRNDPTQDAQSNLSPYLHFGQISAQRIALEVDASSVQVINKEAFLEELIIRKELADNYCFYNPFYDSPRGFPAWAQKTLQVHVEDMREYCYSLDVFENAKTHDPLWNAAQLQMVHTGKMHGYMRMYWAKKVLEWTKDYEEAMRIAVYLNDKYELDGRDPNGYVGIAWSIGGLHDRAWFDRLVFGKIRYMSFNGCKSKFDVQKYISLYQKK